MHVCYNETCYTGRGCDKAWERTSTGHPGPVASLFEMGVYSNASIHGHGIDVISLVPRRGGIWERNVVG